MTNPIVDILKKENYKRINIDSDLSFIFIQAIFFIGAYFEQMGYTDVKPWSLLFEDILYNDGDNPLTIKCVEQVNYNNEVNSLGLYNPDENIIEIKKGREDIMCSTLIHEFLHYLSSINNKPINENGTRYSIIMDEGITELLKLKIQQVDEMSCYTDEIKLASLYEALAKINNKSSDIFKNYLNNEYTFIKPESAIKITLASTRYAENKNPEDFIKVQREVIKNLTDASSVFSINELIQLIETLSSRPLNDLIFIKDFYKGIASIVNNNIKTNIPNFENILYEFCMTLDKYNLYGEEEVCEILCGDIIVPIDKDGNYYNPFPCNSVSSLNISSSQECYTISYKDNTRIIEKDNIKYINWKEYYDSYIEYFAKIGLLNGIDSQNKTK